MRSMEAEWCGFIAMSTAWKPHIVRGSGIRFVIGFRFRVRHGDADEADSNKKKFLIILK